MKTHQLKSIEKPALKKEVPVPVKKVEREPPIWLQVIVGDIKDLLLLTKDKVPTPNKPKTESMDDWKEYFRR